MYDFRSDAHSFELHCVRQASASHLWAYVTVPDVQTLQGTQGRLKSFHACEARSQASCLTAFNELLRNQAETYCMCVVSSDEAQACATWQMLFASDVAYFTLLHDRYISCSYMQHMQVQWRLVRDN